MRTKTALFIFLAAWHVCGQSPNLIQGDSGAETTDRDLAYGTWNSCNQYHGRKEFHNWIRDTSVAFQGKSSIRLDRGRISLNELVPPAGTYTFSFYAKAMENGTEGFLSVHPWKRSTYATLESNAKKVVFSNEWKRYSCTFRADGKQAYTPLCGSRKAVWFDAFMLNRGEKPEPWNNAERVSVGLEFKYAEGAVYLLNEEITVIVRTFPYSASAHPRKVVVTLRNWKDEICAVYETAPGEKRIKLPSGTPGWFGIKAEAMDGDTVLGTRSAAYVIVRPPETPAKGIEPFSGMSAQPVFPEAYRRIGVRWLESHIFWNHAERRKGVYDYDYLHRFSTFRKLKEMGFRNKACFTLGCPDRLQTQEIKKAASAHKTGLFRFLPPENTENSWRAFLRDFLEKNMRYCDSFEIGWELDAQLGRNPYYKHIYPDAVENNFVTGPVSRKAARQIAAAAEEIRKFDPDARIAAGRPSDADTHENFAFTKDLFRFCGKYLNGFGIDCYPRPRWIGPGTPPSGTEQKLAQDYEKALAVMKKHGNGSNIYISEFGYFIDYRHRHNPGLQTEQANRLARSFLFARAVGFKGLHYYTGQYWSNLLENGKYTMSIWERGMPFRAVAAYSAAGNAVENVTETEIIRLSQNFSGIVFHKSDGSAVAALWSLSRNYSPGILLSGTDIEFRDLCGASFQPEKRNGFSRFQLTECPVYLYFRKPGAWNELRRRIRALRVEEDIPADFVIRRAERNRLKVYFQNRSLTRNQSGTIESGKNSVKYHLPAGGACVVNLTADNAKEQTLQMKFDGGYRPFPLHVPKAELYPVVRWRGNWGSVPVIELNTMAHIMPVDVFGWTGADDLSARLQLAHDGKKLRIRAAVTDDRHFNRFSGERIWKGDSIQMGFDPLTNALGKKDGLDPDDTKLTLALANGKPTLAIHNSPNQKLAEKTVFHVVRDEKTKETLYSLEIPLNLLHPALKPDRIFGFNMAVLDDDSGAGMDYWLFFKTGLVEEQRPDKYALMILE